MKKIFLSLVMVALVASSSFAATESAESHRMRDSSGTLMTDYAIASAATVYTESYPIGANVGYSAILAKENKSGGAGDVAISAEYSVDGSTFYTPYTTSAGTLTADSAIVSSLANATRYIQYTARLGNFIRYKIVAAANSQVTLDQVYLKSR